MTRKLVYEMLEKLEKGEVMKPDVMDAVDALLSASNSAKPIVSVSLPPDWELSIYPSCDKGKWQASCLGWISESLDTPEGCIEWGLSLAANDR